jgi:hypothetical protein
VTLDGGANWMKWEHGFPTASAMALIVHPREHDLVIGTHGRAAYIIDDISPLRTLSAATLAEPVHLFEMADAYQYEGSPEIGEEFPGHGEFSGESRPYGALITFSLSAEDLPHPNEEIERGRRAARREAGAAAEEEPAEEGPGRPGMPRRERGPQVTIEISDAGGEVIRTLQAPVKLGVNRAAWNLRHDGFERPSTGQQRFGGFGRGGPEVLPGTYGVTVKYGDHEATGTVAVHPDPRREIPLAEREAKFAAIMHCGAVQEVITEAINRIRATRTEVDAVLGMVRTEGEEGAEGRSARGLTRAGRELKQALDEVELLFWDPPGGGQRDSRRDTPFRGVGSVMRSLGSSWDAPTPAQEGYLDASEAMLQEALVEFNRVFAEDVVAFRDQVQEAGLSFLEVKEPLEVPAR